MFIVNFAARKSSLSISNPAGGLDWKTLEKYKRTRVRVTFKSGKKEEFILDNLILPGTVLDVPRGGVILKSASKKESFMATWPINEITSIEPSR